MMKRVLTALSMAVIATGFASTASADTWAPNSPITPTGVLLTNVGNIAVSKGLNFNCGLSGSAAIAPTGNTAQIHSLAFTAGFFLCPQIAFTGLPYSMTCNANNTVTINNVNVAAITGNCAGNLTGTLNQATGQISFTGATLPTTTGGSDCSITGVIATSPAVSCSPSGP